MTSAGVADHDPKLEPLVKVLCIAWNEFRSVVEIFELPQNQNHLHQNSTSSDLWERLGQNKAEKFCLDSKRKQ